VASIAPNGATPPVETESPIERLIREIEDVLAPLDARREQLEAELLDLNQERERLNAGIAGLSGQLPAQEKRPGPKPSPSQVGRGQHNPSQKILDDVYALVATASRDGKDLTAAEISSLAGLSKSTVMRAVAILREAERMRIVGTRKDENDGRVGGRGANAYAVMPNG
jgi:DNA-binding transcriptional ArsR family regulator